MNFFKVIFVFICFVSFLNLQSEGKITLIPSPNVLVLDSLEGSAFLRIFLKQENQSELAIFKPLKIKDIYSIQIGIQKETHFKNYSYMFKYSVIPASIALQQNNQSLQYENNESAIIIFPNIDTVEAGIYDLIVTTTYGTLKLIIDANLGLPLNSPFYTEAPHFETTLAVPDYFEGQLIDITLDNELFNNRDYYYFWTFKDAKQTITKAGPNETSFKTVAKNIGEAIIELTIKNRSGQVLSFAKTNKFYINQEPIMKLTIKRQNELNLLCDESFPVFNWKLNGKTVLNLSKSFKYRFNNIGTYLIDCYAMHDIWRNEPYRHLTWEVIVTE